MIFLIILTFFFLFLYCVLIVLYNRWFKKLRPYSLSEKTGKIFFTIIIPARNEERNIGRCLQSIIDNDYDKSFIEIIVIDDFSEDETAQIVEKYNRSYPFIRLIKMQNLIDSENKINSYKKLAIQKAVEQASGEWIVATDADCIAPRQWLSGFNSFICKRNPYFVAAPVKFINQRTFLSVFQCLDFLSLQGITAASVSAGMHSMCNGANLCYRKDIFFEVEGFKDIDRLASGDDMFLMRKIQKKYPGKIEYLFSPNSIIETMPMLTVKTFINQRIRWASKAGTYDDKKMTAVLFLVYFFNFLLLLLFFSGFFNYIYFIWFVLFVGIKNNVEIFFMKRICVFFNERSLLKYFPLMQPFHIFYTVISGFLGQIGAYEWKGRKTQ